MNCPACTSAIAAFHPAGPDLADAVALHIDGCARCRAAFDARFPPWVEAGAGPTPSGARPGWRSRGMPATRWLVACAAAAVATVALAAGLAWRGAPEPEHAFTEAERPAGDLADVPWLVGQGSTDFGDVTLVVFWEAWCHHCDEALVYTEGLYDALAADGLDVVGVTALSKGVTRQEALDYVAAAGLTFPQAWDRDRALATRFGTRAWPRAYVVRDGRIVWEGHPSHVSEGQLRALLP